MNKLGFEALYSPAEEECVKLYIARAIQETPENIHGNLRLEDFITTYGLDYTELVGEDVDNNAHIYSLFRDQSILERPTNLVLIGQLMFSANRNKWSIDKTNKIEEKKLGKLISPLTTQIRDKHMKKLEYINKANNQGIKFTQRATEINPDNFTYDFPILYKFSRFGEDVVLFFNDTRKFGEDSIYNDLRLFRSNGRHAEFDADMFYNYQRNGNNITERLNEAFK